MRLSWPPIPDRFALAAPLAAVLIVAACSRSDSDATPATTPPPAPPPAATVTTTDDSQSETTAPDPDQPAATPTDDPPTSPDEESTETPSDDPPPSSDVTAETDQALDDARLDLLIEITDPLDLALLQRIGQTAGDRRGLPLLADVPAFLIRRSDIDEFLLSFLDEDDRREADFIETTYRLLGIFGADTEYLSLIEDLYTGLVLGFYDFDLESFVIVSSDDGIASRDIDTITHEYVHALQDQHFDLRETFESFGSNSDQTLAYQFVIEGDARLAEQLLSDIEAEVAGQLPPASDRLPGTGGRIPILLQAIFLAPYREGVSAINTIVNETDLGAINTLLAQPPLSTEQLLHLEKLATGERPIPVPDPDAQPSLGAGWSLIHHDTLGEFFLRLLIDEELSGSDANAAAAGWGGDRIATYRSDTGETLLTWNLRWDNADEGAEFLDAMFAWLDRRSDGAATDTANGAARFWASDDRSYWIQGDGDSAWITIGTRADDVFRVAIAHTG
jgi:hypothetical protein